MIIKVNKAEEFEKKYPQTFLKGSNHKKAMLEMNKAMQLVRRIFLQKLAQSKIDSREIVLI